MSISGTAAKPVMITSGITVPNITSYIIAIDLTTGNLVWKFRYDEGKGAAAPTYGQFPIVTSATGQPVVMMTTNKNGIWALGQ